ncbi:MAG: pilus assembly PilX N-terminal domain-containing protein [Acidobacteria bacterium]|nr:pilus assembly PilX N-terminal domain-containing protein [Acidobacteriota bacterium]MCI0722730.1 pilus assembly PilX N-terminal domain-containing protein [Acidobacteriota bacterium]
MNSLERGLKRETGRGHKEGGIALMVALFALLILSLIGVAMLTRATTEVLISDNFKRSKGAYFNAEAGTEEARFRLTPAAAGNRIDTLFPSDGTEANTVVYIRANTSIVPTNQSSSNLYRDLEYASIKTRNSSGSQTSTTSTLSGYTPIYLTSLITGNNPYAWVKITRKTEALAGQNVDSLSTNQNYPVFFGSLDLNGKISQYVRDPDNTLTHSLDHSNPVYLITAMSLDSTGAQRKIQTELVVMPPIEANAAVDSFQDVDFQGTLDIDGHDECHPGDDNYSVYGVSSAGTIDNPNGSQVVDGQDPPLPAPPGSPSLCPGCPFNHDVPSLIDRLKSHPMFQSITSAGLTCSGTPVSCSGSNAQLGTPPTTPGGSDGTPKYYYSPGDLRLSGNGTLGYGILVVDGDVQFNGGIYFEGIIIAKGTFNFTGGGADAINIRGAIIAGDSISDTTTDVGGSIDIQYNSCSIANVFTQMPMTKLTFKDRALY